MSGAACSPSGSRRRLCQQTSMPAPRAPSMSFGDPATNSERAGSTPSFSQSKQVRLRPRLVRPRRLGGHDHVERDTDPSSDELPELLRAVGHDADPKVTRAGAGARQAPRARARALSSCPGADPEPAPAARRQPEPPQPRSPRTAGRPRPSRRRGSTPPATARPAPHCPRRRSRAPRNPGAQRRDRTGPRRTSDQYPKDFALTACAARTHRTCSPSRRSCFVHT